MGTQKREKKGKQRGRYPFIFIQLVAIVVFFQFHLFIPTQLSLRNLKPIFFRHIPCLLPDATIDLACRQAAMANAAPLGCGRGRRV